MVETMHTGIFIWRHSLPLQPVSVGWFQVTNWPSISWPGFSSQELKVQHPWPMPGKGFSDWPTLRGGGYFTKSEPSHHRYTEMHKYETLWFTHLNDIQDHLISLFVTSRACKNDLEYCLNTLYAGTLNRINFTIWVSKYIYRNIIFVLFLNTHHSLLVF